MLDAFWAFLKNPANRDAVGWIGGGIVVVASGLWPVIEFLSKKRNCRTWIELGDLWMVRGSLAEAEKAFRSTVTAAEDTEERGLAVAYNRDVLVAQSNLPEALKSYRDSLAITDRLAKVDPGNAGWQRDLAVSYGRVATVERRLNAREEAVRKFHLGLGIIEHLAQQSP